MGGGGGGGGAVSQSICVLIRGAEDCSEKASCLEL